MASKTYVTRGYSTYTNIQPQQGGYDYEPRHSGNQYVVETKTIEKVRPPVAGYSEFVGSPSKAKLLEEFVYSPTTMPGGSKYQYDDYELNYGLNYRNSSPPISPNKHTPGYFSKESNHVYSGPGYVRTENVSGPNKSWQAAGPPPTHHPLTTSTNNINEALELLEESVYYSPRADPRRRGVLDDLSTREQPREAQKRYAKPYPKFGAKPIDARHNFMDTRSTIDSREAAMRYRGSYVP